MPWLIWGASALFAFFVFFLQIMVSVMVDPLKQAFNITNVGIGFVASSFFYTYTIMQIPIGALIDKYGVKRILAISVVGTFFSCVLFSLAGSFSSAIAARIAMGLFAASAFPCAFCLAAIWFPSNLFPTVVGFTEMLGMIGAAFGADLLSMFVIHYGWRSAVLLCAYFAAVIGFLIICAVKDRRSGGMITDEGAIEETERKNEAIEKSLVDKIKCVLLNRQLRLLSLFTGLTFVPLISFGGLWGIPFIRSKYPVGLGFAASCMVLLFVGAAAGNPIIAWLSHKFKKEKEFMFWGPIISLVSMCIILYVRLPYDLLFLLLVILGFSSAVYIIPFSIVKKTVSRDVLGTAMSFTSALCGGFGALLMQPAIGWLIHINEGHSIKFIEFAGFPNPYAVGLTLIPACLILSLLVLVMIKGEACRLGKSQVLLS